MFFKNDKKYFHWSKHFYNNIKFRQKLLQHKNLSRIQLKIKKIKTGIQILQDYGLSNTHP